MKVVSTTAIALLIVAANAAVLDSAQTDSDKGDPRLTFADGRQLSREFKTGEVAWMKEQMHIGENIGRTDTRALIFELKEAR